MALLRHPELDIVGPLDHPGQIAKAIVDVDAVLIRLWPLDREAIRSAKHLKVIAKHGVGLDNIDLEACREQGVLVTVTDQANRDTVSEYVLGALIAVARRWRGADAAVRRGEYGARDRYVGVEWSGKTIGVVGYGRIGSTLTPKLVYGLGSNVLVYDPYVPRKKLWHHERVQWAGTLDECLAASDAVTLHVPLTPETFRLFDQRRIQHMKPGAFLINAARGPIVDPDALVWALQSGHLAGAAVDEFDPEPPLADCPLWDLPNLLVTPHIAASTEEAVRRMGIAAALAVMETLGLSPSD